MSSDRVPTRSEVTGWSPQQLADFMKRMNLSGCDKTVIKNSITGSRFVNLSDNDLQRFPKLHTPMISKLSSEISRKEERRGFFPKKPTPKYLEPDAGADEPIWDDDEFDDDDYETPNSGDEDGSGGDYESPNDDVDGGDYEDPPSEPPEDLGPRAGAAVAIAEDDYIDNRNSSKSPPVCPRPPAPPSSLGAPPSSLGAPPLRAESSFRRDSSPLRGGPTNGRGGAPPGRGAPLPPEICRDNKPGRGSRYNASPIRGPHCADRPPVPSWKPQSDVQDSPPWSKPPGLPLPPAPAHGPAPSHGPAPGHGPAPASIGRLDPRREQTHDEARKHNTFPLHKVPKPARPGFMAPPPRQGDSLPPSVHSAGSLPHRLQPAMAENLRASFSVSTRPPTSHTQGLDPRWYVGKVTRGQAEGSLRQVHKDGAYLVRDSTRQQVDQPFTLMVLYQDRVYNIQIRQNQNQFLLGTGLKVQESFPSVGDIIAHYSQSPLLLINTKHRSSGQQNQCLLSDPAGAHLTRNTWS